MRQHYVYTLSDPVTHRVRYVGCTVTHPQARLLGHLYESNYRHSPNEEKQRWVRNLKVAGLLPLIDTVEIVSDEEFRVREKYWIAFYRECGADLLNQRHNGYKPAVDPERGGQVSYQAARRRFLNGDGPDPGDKPAYIAAYVARKQQGA